MRHHLTAEGNSVIRGAKLMRHHVTGEGTQNRRCESDAVPFESQSPAAKSCRIGFAPLIPESPSAVESCRIGVAPLIPEVPSAVNSCRIGVAPLNSQVPSAVR